MGDIHQDTHVIRSSSMSLALRWKRENAGMISKAAIISIIITLMFLLLLYGTVAKTVTVTVDGKEMSIKTRQWVVQNVLQEQGISLQEQDRVSKPLASMIKNGDTIVIRRATPITLTADGESNTYYSIGTTVEDVLKDLNITLGDEDKVSPAREAAVSSNDEIKITRVSRVVEEVTEPLPYDIVKQNDPKLVKGKEQVVQDGQEGVVTKKIEKVFEDGTLVAENVLDQTVQSESVNKVVAVGTKNPIVILSASSPNVDEVTKNGVTFGYKQILNNVTITAYSAGPESTGKTSAHPQYGMTYSGTRVSEGRTIAVDPKVIPIGWWVYIEGIGLRRAEDIGSGVKGNKIDVYYESEEYAQKFGLKRGYKVYIIGKDKPAMN